MANNYIKSILQNSTGRNSIWIGALALATLVSCGPPQENTNFDGQNDFTDDSIRGGQPVGEKDIISSSTVALIDDQGGLCSGSLIGKNLVLTAAHCISPHSQKMAVVFDRNLNITESSDVLRPVTRAIIHPRYLATHPIKSVTVNKQTYRIDIDNYDLAIVSFSGETPINYKAANVLSEISVLKNNVTVILAGYGVQGDPQHSSGILLKTQVKILDSRLAKTEILLNQTGRTGACQGDSGGPAFVQVKGVNLLWGVTSRSLEPMNSSGCPIYAIYTNILAHQDWIKATIAVLRN